MKTDTKNLRELDAWIGVNVFGKKAISKDDPPPTEGTEDDYFVIEYIHISGSLPHYTKGEQFQQLLEKCGQKMNGPVRIYCIRADENFSGVASFWVQNPETESDTLPLAVCKFIKALHSK